MKYLIDSNVLSEAMKKAPDATVITWLLEHEVDSVINPIVAGEIEHGILMLGEGRRRTSLMDWYSRAISSLGVLNIDLATAQTWARIMTELGHRGRTMPIKDSLIAASALQHDLIVVTRDLKDYKFCGVKIFNPFTSESF